MNASQSRCADSRLTVIVLAEDDPAGLEETLLSVESLADEIVVLDIGQHRSVSDIAANYGAIATSFDWADDFSAARNHAWQVATGDWVLWLDAGETFDAEDALQLRDAMNNGQFDTATAYWMIVKLPATPGAIAAEQVARIRLLPRAQGICYHGRVCESVEPSLTQLGIKLDGVPYRIRHGMQANDAQHKLAAARRNRRLAQLEIEQHGPSPRLLNCLAEAAQALGETDTAVKYYRQARAASAPRSTEMLEAYYGLLSALDCQADARTTQISLCIEALEVYPLDAQLLCAMGGYLQGEGRLDLAAKAYQTAFRYGRVNPLTWHVDEIEQIAAVCLNLVFQLQGKPREALEVLRRAAERNSACPRIRRALLDFYIKQGDLDLAIAQLDHLDLTASRETMHGVVRGACLAATGDWSSAKDYLDAAHQSGCRDPLCLKWLSVCLLSTHDAERAQAVLAQWIELEPFRAEPRLLLQTIQHNSDEATKFNSDAQRNFRVDQAGFPAQSTPQAAPIASHPAAG